MTEEQMILRIRQEIGAKILQAREAGKESLAKKWEAELTHFVLPPYARALVEIGFDPGRVGSMAIYVAQKVRRMVAFHLGAGMPDPYTLTILRAARAMGPEVKNAVMRMALSGGGRDVPVAHKAGDTTAQTQASSTRKALLALGVAEPSGRGDGAGLAINLNHKLLEKIA